NLQPKGMISEGNYDGVEFLDILKAANSTAWHLKHNEKVDMVIAITHIGYDGQPAPHDIDLAANSEDIDIIIGGHTHTTLVDGHDLTRIPNSAGKRVLVTQTGSRGVNLGEITIDLDNLSATSRLIPVDSRLDTTAPDPTLVSLIEPYRQGIDSIMNVKIARSDVELNEPRLLNLFSDIVLERGRQLADNVDLALLNKGGIRRTLPKGNITEGMIMTTLPFNNRVTVLDVSGADLLEALNIMAARDDQGIAGNVKVITEGSPAHVAELTINGEPVIPEKIYRVATIDYLANGGDYMVPLTRAPVIATSPNVVYADVIDYMRSLGKKKLNPSSTPRFTD
ncbi:MAG: 5'-nucleotidase C-terminal domain-containing protein, partial [Muribaculaceae bacterium]|nr:5'-nucleotidase C-terminal domain-containing protein [Muribaculaceae bacterium]